MGTLDEHWCNVCKRSLNKKKDKYVEFELINMAEKIKITTKRKAVKPKGLICQNCIDANPDLKKAVELMVKTGNPLFKVEIKCLATGKCEDFKPSQSQRNCAHIAVISDKMYCKRSHVGVVKLIREKAEVQREERVILNKFLKRVLKDDQIKALINLQPMKKYLDQAYLEPTTVISEEKD